MSPQQRDTGPSFCWHCRNQLMRRKGGGFIFRLVQDPMGHQHRVRQSCLPDAVGDGIKAVQA